MTTVDDTYRPVRDDARDLITGEPATHCYRCGYPHGDSRHGRHFECAAAQPHTLDNLVTQSVTSLFVAATGQGGRTERDIVACAPNLIRMYALLQQTADEELPKWVDLMRSKGSTWADIGRLLGVSRQAAQQKYGR